MNKSSLLVFLAISTILISGSLVGNAFAAPQPNGQPFQALDNRITAIEQDNVRSDSFFDVFFDVFTVDSFFDIFTELQTTNDAQQAQIDSFFDVFTEISVLEDRIAALESNNVDCTARGPGVDLHGCDLTEAELHNQDFTDTNFRGANLSVANFFRSNLSGADFSGANLIGASLAQVDLTDATLRGADLSNADIGFSNLSGADFNGASVDVNTAFGGSYANPPCTGIAVCLTLPLSP
ncbi:MAG TPA: pentapeptide repeat-containing protein [Nitrosarchaeum sp.]|nr:pentapeptide repeat-containing protein [Nitrosarchaeum sp.]